jgi:sn-glycerol 3-phosphate transport system substrate-binding protein
MDRDGDGPLSILDRVRAIFVEQTDRTARDGGEVTISDGGIGDDGTRHESNRSNATAGEERGGGGPPPGPTADGEPSSESTAPDAQATAAALRDHRTVIEQCAAGDLSARMDESAGSAELQALAASFNDLVDEWAGTMKRVQEFGEQVDAATRQVTRQVEAAKESSREVGSAVREISDGAVTQNEHIDEIASEMRNLSAATEEVASTADEIERATAQATERGETGQEAAEDAVTDLDAIDDRTVEAVDSVEALQEQVEEIEEIVEFITNITDQTHVLSLNASIEAARADNDGAGFAVVADEVKALADETREATEEIERSIDAIRGETESTVEDMHETRHRVDDGSETISEALDALDALVDDIQETSVSVAEISDATDSQAQASQEVVAMVDEVGAISEETASQSESVTATARRQTTALTEAAASAETLVERSESLAESLSDIEVTSSTTASDVTTIRFWHAMGGEKALLLEELAQRYESTVDGVEIDLVSKGSYRGALTATMAAVESGDPPSVAQLFEIGTKRALDSGAFEPVESVLEGTGTDPADLLAPVRNYYRHDGSLYSLPFNSSNPVLFVNRDAFRAAGLDPNSPPETFEEVTAAAERLVESGMDAGATWANYSWFVEQWFAEQNQPLVDRENGRTGTPREAYLDSEAGRRLFEWWTDLHERGLYHDPGIEARGEARSRFLDGDVGMLVGSSSKIASVVEGAEERGFDVGTGMLPVPGERHGVVVGGASLWVPEGLAPAEREAVGQFLAWLARPEQQEWWHRNTGYFPVHEGAVDRLERDGWFEQNPAFQTAFDQLLATRDSPATNGARIGPFDTVRTLVEEGFVSMTRGQDVETALGQLNDELERLLAEYARS